MDILLFAGGAVILAMLFIGYAKKEQKKKEVHAAMQADIMLAGARARTEKKEKDNFLKKSAKIYVHKQGKMVIVTDGIFVQYEPEGAFLVEAIEETPGQFTKIIEENYIYLGEL